VFELKETHLRLGPFELMVKCDVNLTKDYKTGKDCGKEVYLLLEWKQQNNKRAKSSKPAKMLGWRNSD
jgi:hypothetical protein